MKGRLILTTLKRVCIFVLGMGVRLSIKDEDYLKSGEARDFIGWVD